MHEAAISNIENLGFSDRITALLGDAREVLEGLKGEEPFDFVFIDAAKSHYKAFWDLAFPLCEDNALIVCDNVLMKGMTASDEFDTKHRYKTSIRKMREFLDYINNIEGVETSVLPVGDGVSISVINK
ncbi:MAG: class I SAM-dependent methyltransferase [Firmicutes bacterium]|nr:class I SAM-dependent methyltransferase [Bacillota bacterium]